MDQISSVDVTSIDGEHSPPIDGIERRTVFDADGFTLVYARMSGESESDWHHHGDHDVYGYLQAGTAIFEHGSNGERRTTVNSGEFFHVRPRTVHRVRNPDSLEQIWLLNYLGTGQLVTPVQGLG